MFRYLLAGLDYSFQVVKWRYSLDRCQCLSTVSLLNSHVYQSFLHASSFAVFESVREGVYIEHGTVKSNTSSVVNTTSKHHLPPSSKFSMLPAIVTGLHKTWLTGLTHAYRTLFQNSPVSRDPYAPLTDALYGTDTPTKRTHLLKTGHEVLKLYLRLYYA